MDAVSISCRAWMDYCAVHDMKVREMLASLHPLPMILWFVTVDCNIEAWEYSIGDSASSCHLLSPWIVGPGRISSVIYGHSSFDSLDRLAVLETLDEAIAFVSGWLDCTSSLLPSMEYISSY
jgi:hypothetical protein